MVKEEVGALPSWLRYAAYRPVHPVVARRFKGDSIMWPYGSCIRVTSRTAFIRQQKLCQFDEPKAPGTNGITIWGIRLTRDSWPDDRRDLKCRKARPQRPRLQMSEALMLQSVPPYVDTPEYRYNFFVHGFPPRQGVLRFHPH